MLYDCWRQIARENREEIALIDCLLARQWTFGQLDDQTESEELHAPEICYPRGVSSQFIFEVLRAWRAQRVTCPVDSQQPQVESLGTLPPGCVHLKITSASSGVPKIIAFRADQLAADAANIISTMKLRRDWPNLGAISLAHSYGFSSLVLPLLLHGIPLVLLGSPLPAMLRRASLCFSELTLPAVPALWRTWFESKALPGNIRLAISAGAPLPLELEQAVHETAGIKIHNFYGASECGGIAYDDSELPRSDASCAGRPMDHVELGIGHDGCIEVRSGAVGLGYWPEESPSFGHGTFRTTDLGQMSGGLVYLQGRRSEQINVAGRKVSPETIERELASHPEVRACLVFGAPSPCPEHAEMIVACVALKSRRDAQGLRQYLLGRLPAWQVPRAWWVVDQLPMNQRGKLSRNEWRQRYFAQLG
jgi:long-chain acyl-CoA synthetase